MFGIAEPREIVRRMQDCIATHNAAPTVIYSLDIAARSVDFALQIHKDCMTDSQKDLVLHLLRQGDWSDAVVAYCEETGADVETAQTVVKQLAIEHRLNPARKWWVLGFTMLMTSILVFCILM